MKINKYVLPCLLISVSLWNFNMVSLSYIYLHIKLSFVMFTLDEHFFSTENLQIFTCVLFLLSIRSVSSDNSYDWWGQCHVTLYLVVFLNAAIHTTVRVLSFFKTPIWRGVKGGFFSERADAFVISSNKQTWLFSWARI